MTDKQAGTVVHAAAQVVLPGVYPMLAGWWVILIPVHFSVAVGEWRTDEYDEGFTVEIEHPFQSILEAFDQGAAFEGQDFDTYRLSNSDLSYSYAESWVTWNFGFSQESKPNGQTWSATWEWPQLTDELHDPYLLLFPQTVTLDVDSFGDTLGAAFG